MQRILDAEKVAELTRYLVGECLILARIRGFDLQHA